ncbi:MAG: ATP-dependent Clp protease proteolytic subunit, partial [Gammaproteobacteria bacterium]|nr:ATP-dependent Clp protease proteolytic subunit [Gammaproteobacteria bacterium]
MTNLFNDQISSPLNSLVPIVVEQ